MAIRGTDKPVPWLLWNERPQLREWSQEDTMQLLGLHRELSGVGTDPQP